MVFRARASGSCLEFQCLPNGFASHQNGVRSYQSGASRAPKALKVDPECSQKRAFAPSLDSVKTMVFIAWEACRQILGKV